MSTGGTWRDISENPINPEVHFYLERELNAKRSFKRAAVIEALVEECVGVDVLDIGFVEHTLDFVRSSNWKHAKLARVARTILGIDIVEEGVKEALSKGFNAIVCDACSDADLGQTFDVVIIGDVIEHVNDPVALLKFAKRHLRQGGKVFFTTPNPFGVGFILRMLKSGTVITNAEHVAWFSPCQVLELGRRAGLSLQSFSVLAGKRLSKSNFLWAIVYPLMRFRPEAIGNVICYEMTI